MRKLTIRLPERLVAEIEAESRKRRVSKSEVVRSRLERPALSQRASPTSLESIADLIGSVNGLPPDLSRRKKQYLQDTGYGQQRED